MASSVRAALLCVPVGLFLLFDMARAEEPFTPQLSDSTLLARMESLPLQHFNNVDLAHYLQVRNRVTAEKPREPGDEIGFFVNRLLNQPYRLGAARFDLREGDCVTFTERVIALGLSRDWPSYHMLCNRLRFKDGVIDDRNRNWFTEADWVPNNSWLFEEITEKLGAGSKASAREYLHRINRKRFYDQLKLEIDAPGLEILTLKYVPKEYISEVLPLLRTGDVILVVRGEETNRYCDHMGVAVRTEDGVLNVAHSSKPRVRQEPLTRLLERCQWISGFKFLRVHENALAIVDTELARCRDHLPVPEPAEQDAATKVMRELVRERAAQAKQATSGSVPPASSEQK